MESNQGCLTPWLAFDLESAATVASSDWSEMFEAFALALIVLFIVAFTLFLIGGLSAFIVGLWSGLRK